MNREYILYNLKAASEELTNTIKEIEDNETYEYGDYWVGIQHLYHHINTAWNARESTKEESDVCSESNFYKWRTFPTDLHMGR
jgi:hypothetical protein